MKWQLYLRGHSMRRPILWTRMWAILLMLSFTGCSTLERWSECLRDCDQPRDRESSTPRAEPLPDQSSRKRSPADTSAGERLTSISSGSTPTRFTLPGGISRDAWERRLAYDGGVVGLGAISDTSSSEFEMVGPYDFSQESSAHGARSRVNLDPTFYTRRTISNVENPVFSAGFCQVGRMPFSRVFLHVPTPFSVRS